MGCVLGQHDEFGKKEQAIYYLIKKFTTCKMNYSLLKRACCTLVWATYRLRQYMLSYTTWLVSKMDPFKYIFEKPTLTGRIARWQPMHPEFPDEDIMALFEEEGEDEDKDKWIVWFDGASNALGHGIRAVLLKGEWETKDHKLIPYQAYIKELMELFDDISFHHIPREENQVVYALATLSSMFKIGPHIDFSCIDIKCHIKPVHCCLIEEDEDGNPWYFNIKTYIKDKEYPSEASDNDKRTLQRLAASFLLSGDALYKRNHDMVLLQCVNENEAEQILFEVHEGSFGTHANGHAMARKILRVGYY
ncbi:uncharacterized protein LOC114424059 [Glycine soja]|uniref:uncharacterized protein LOC114424059 n=1 Tax=Glycine soja TaxID=3848 RepID=UPI001039684D|nr:uncharacterized protein LOC114424059 [Glycine soja]